MPIELYADECLGGNAVVVIGKEEAQVLEERGLGDDHDEDQLRPIEYEPSTNSMEQIDQLDSVATMKAQRLVASVRSNLSAKDRAIRRAIFQLFRNMRQQM